jgi:hypothetical protein
LVRYIVRNIDGKYAVHKENSGVASFCETQEAALSLARKLAKESGEGTDKIEQLDGGAIAVWREVLATPSRPADAPGQIAE